MSPSVLPGFASAATPEQWKVGKASLGTIENEGIDVGSGYAPSRDGSDAAEEKHDEGGIDDTTDEEDDEKEGVKEVLSTEELALIADKEAMPQGKGYLFSFCIRSAKVCSFSTTLRVYRYSIVFLFTRLRVVIPNLLHFWAAMHGHTRSWTRFMTVICTKT